MLPFIRAFTLALCGLIIVAAGANAVEPGELVGPVRLQNSRGETIVVENYAERPATAIVFLSSRCPATEKNIADIIQLYQKYRYQEVLYLGVSGNPAETGEELHDFTTSRGLVFTVYRDPDAELVGRLGVSRTPEVVLLNREGRLVYRGGLDRKEGFVALETAVKQILADDPVTVASIPARGTSIDSPGPKIERTDPYGSLSFSSEVIFERIPGAPAHHCSVITQAPNGDLLCVWYGGTFESADDQTLFLARRRPDERRWSQPEALIRDSKRPPGNAVIFVDGKDRVQIAWGRMERTRPIRRGGGWDRCRLMGRTSTDNGHTWSDDRVLMADDKLVQNDALWCVPRNPPVTLKNGNQVLALEARQENVGGSVFLISTNQGDAWERGGFLTGGSQPAVIQRSDGSLLALMRASGHSTSATSTDDGRTWSSVQKTSLRNPGSGISMTKLANGHLVFVFNDSPDERTPLSIARSTDDGTTWETPMHLESNAGEYSYPSVIQSADGMIHVSYTYRRYTIKHVEFNEDWLIHTERPN